VHSNEQIIASVEWGGSGALQFSQEGLNSSMAKWSFARRLDLDDQSRRASLVSDFRSAGREQFRAGH